jgi:Tol biopolymer transport system component/DNA-binding winged helix-turn-helix (wHTH) protein
MNSDPEQFIRFAEFELDPAHRLLRRAGSPLALNAKAFDVLVFLAENAGRVVTKEEILDAVWENQFVEEANLKVQISALRKALGERKGENRLLVTIPGKGYKFVADIQNEPNEIVIEKHKIARLVVEEIDEKEKVEEKSRKGEGERKPLIPNISFSPFLPFSLSQTLTVVIVSALLLATGFGIYRYLLRAKPSRPPFERVRLTRLTNSGKVSAVTLSADGKFIAYVLREAEGNSLWVRQTGAANDTRLLPPVNAEFWGLTFTPDGTQIYYNLFTGDKTDLELFRIPTLGGVSQKVPRVIAFAISFAPDGKRFAYVQPDSESSKNYLVVADADGTNQHTIAEKPQPNTFVFDGDFTAWSPDGETIACLVNHLEPEANYHSLVGVNVRDGAERLLGSQKWREIRGFEWLKDGSGLLVSGGEKSGAKNQIWVVTPADDQVRAVTDDFNSYSSLGIGGGGDSFIALESSETNSLAIGEAAGGGNENFKEIVAEVGALSPLAWTPDGRIVFRSLADGAPNLWTVEPDGANRRQLTVDAQVDERGMCLSPDGKFIVFVSWRSGKSNLWRVDADGQNLKQLTNGEADAYPSCPPDGKTVIFQRGILSQPRLWKVSMDGGEASQISDMRAKWGAVSTDGSRLSYFKMVDNQWRIGFLSPDGKPAAPDISVPANLKENKIHWSADNRELYYIASQGSTGNVWRLSIADSATKPFTGLKNYSLTDFSFSADHKYLALAQSVRLSDVVLISEVK